MNLSPRIPLSTYRVQFNRNFGFDNARRLVPYLQLLGVTDLYPSPLTQARPQSPHGYDVTDPTRLNSELGTERAFHELTAELTSTGMGLLLDIVPNHMAVSSANPWWMDVLEKGPESTFARCFDIEWHGPKKALQNKIMLPILAQPYGQTLENGEFTLRFQGGGFWVNYHGTKLPLILESCVPILNRCVQRLRDQLGTQDPGARQVEDVLDTLKRQIGERLASSETTPWTTLGVDAARQFDPDGAESLTSLPDGLSNEIKERLGQLGESEAVRRCIDDSLCDFQGRKEDVTSFDQLDGILEKQFYWLAFWRLSDEEINYRRFFAINDLIGVRQDDPTVFALTHALVLRLVKEGSVTGLRIDHIDGLLDPLGYLQQLREQTSRELGSEQESRGHVYTVVEKILSMDERLPDEWPVEGTTGYDFLNLANAVFVDPSGAQCVREVYQRFVDSTRPFEDIVYQQKMLVMRTLFAGEIRSLGLELGRLAEQDRHARDLPLIELTDALAEVTAHLSIYRTYIRNLHVSPTDRRCVDRAVDTAEDRNPAISRAAFEFLRQVLLLDARPHLPGQQLEARLRFVMRWQQITGPIMAKGFEDTALYLYNPLVSLNEVGGRLPPPDSPIDEFHSQMRERLRRWPYALNTTSTHDTKRSEDERARINVLTEMPAEWEKRLRLWSRWNEDKRTGRGERVPDPSEEVLLYQTMLGAWPSDIAEVPSFRARLQAYMVKAAREAKEHTQWAQPDTERESCLNQFIDAILVPSIRNRFLRDFLRFGKRLAHLGAINSLSQTLLKICAPGVPDFYQGSELWDLRLVDPDNRGAVDFEKRNELLRQLKARESERLGGAVLELLRTWQNGSVKLYLTAQALDFRRNHSAVFLEGDYLSLEASGTLKEHVCAFARSHEGEWVVVIVPRILAGLVGFGEFPVGQSMWGRSVISLPTAAPGEWHNVLTGESLGTLRAARGRILPLGEVFRSFPVAMLTGSSRIK